MDLNTNLNWLEQVSAQLGMTPEYNTEPVVEPRVDLNVAYGLPPRVQHIGNVPVPPMSVGSSSAMNPEAHEIPQSVEGPADGSQRSTASKRARTKTSPAWEIFEEIKGPNGNTVAAKCLICLKVYDFKVDQGTGTLLKHKHTHDKKGETVPEERRTSMVQTQLGVGGGYLKYDPDKVRKFFIKYCVRSEKPLSMTCDPLFEEFITESLHPQFRKSYHKKTNDDLFNIFWTKRSELYDEFRSANYKVSITSDIWSAGKHNMSYSSVTAHWITQDTNFGTWFLNKRLIAFRPLEYPHDANHIFEYVLAVIEEYQLKDKIFAVAFDNASNCNAAIRLLSNNLQPMLDGAFFHTKCACHILNLIVKAGLEVKEVDELLEKYKNALRYVDSGIRKKQAFADLCTRMGVRHVRIPWDVDTRWNSTYRLLRKTQHLRPALDHATSRTPQGQQFRLSSSEWDALEQMVPFLEVFYTATVRLSASYTPTASALLEELVTISDWYITQDVTTLPHDSILRHALPPIKAKFLKYWTDIPPVSILATCLDPRWKLANTGQFLKTIRSNMGLPEGNVFAEVDNLFESVYRIYEQRHSQTRVASNAPTSSNPSSRGRSTISRIKSIIGRSNEAPSPSTPATTSTEIQLYTSPISSAGTINIDDENFNILQFWYQVKGLFPILSSMALDIFAVPVSTVASESCFSAANRVLTDKRTRLGTEVFEALVLLKDWYDAEKRLQDKSWMYAIENEGNEQVTGASSSNPEPSQQVEEVQDPYASNPYMYNYEEYGYSMYNQQHYF